MLVGQGEPILVLLVLVEQGGEVEPAFVHVELALLADVAEVLALRGVNRHWNRLLQVAGDFLAMRSTSLLFSW